MPKKYRGESEGHGALDALEKAIDKAWQEAKRGGSEDKDLKVEEWYVRGHNPINWSRVTLTDESA
jgi:hypothetical protein